MIDRLIQAGMNVARLNFSHGTHEQHAETIRLLKEARERHDIPLSIMLDTKGPEIRVGLLVADQIELKARQKVKLIKGDPKNDTEIPINPPSIIDDLQEGQTVLFDDGYINSKVVKKEGDCAIVQIENPGHLKSRKGVNIPHESITLPAMTEQDIADIKFGCQHDVDLIAASFIRCPDHVMEIRNLLIEEGHGEIAILAKIESAEGVKNFDAIVQVADGIMVARGDLGVEMPLTQVPKLQKMMIRKCYQLAKPVVTATQMLESMITAPRPTRAEVSDVANAIYDSTSAVMLSGETAVGKYPIMAVKIMKSIIEETERDFDYRDFFIQGTRGAYYDVSSSVALAAVKTAYSSQAKALIAFTKSGKTPRAMSRFRPVQPIIALTPDRKCYHQMALTWGVAPFYGPVKNIEEGFKVASCSALKAKLARYGDLVVISAGSPFGVSGTTNTMIVVNMGDVLVRGMISKGKRVIGQVALVQSFDESQKYQTRGKIVVLSTSNDHLLPMVKHAAGLILQNHPDDQESERHAKGVAKSLNIPILVRADGATDILRDGQLITLDPKKGLVFKGALLTEEEMIKEACKLVHDE